MGFIDRFFSRKVETRAAAPTSWDLLATLGLPTLAGGYVAPAVVEGNAAAFCAVQIISEAVGSLPMMIYRRLADEAREAAPSHPVARLFADRPNDMQTPAEFVTMMQANCLMHGWALAEIERNGNGQPVALWPIHPGQASIERIPGTRRIRFQISAR